jgi:hypothetical protein
MKGREALRSIVLDVLARPIMVGENLGALGRYAYHYGLCEHIEVSTPYHGAYGPR